MALQFKDDEIVVNTDPLATDKLFAEVNFRLKESGRIVASSLKLHKMFRLNTNICDTSEIQLQCLSCSMNSVNLSMNS